MNKLGLALTQTYLVEVVVVLDLAVEPELVPESGVGPLNQLVEDVEVPLTLILVHHSGLLQ